MHTISVSPFRCRVWSLHARLDENLTEENCKTEIESFERHGQLVPTLGRRLRDDPDYDVEIVCGARRLFVARHLNMPLLVEIRDIDDREGIIAMDLENRLRQDISVFERGTSYARWLQEGYFASQDEIATSLRVSASQVSRLLKLARLPAEIIEAFSNPVEICEGWGTELANLLKERDSERRVIQAARSIAAVAPRPPGSEVYRQLCAAGKGDRVGLKPRIVRGEQGEELFRVKNQRDAVVLTVSLDILTRDSLQAIEECILEAVEADDIEETLEEDLEALLELEAATSFAAAPGYA